MSWIYPGSMANLSFETRVVDCEIRLLLGLPMADTADDFLGGFSQEIEDRDEEITDLDQKIEDEQKDYAELEQEMKDQLGELRQEISRLTIENGF